MNAVRTSLSALVVFVVAGCSTLTIRTDYDPQATFTQLRTYDWTDYDVDAGGNPAINSPLVERHIRTAVDSALASMGYQNVTSGDVDFWVASRVVADEQSTIDRSYGYSPYSGHRGFGYRRFGHRGFGHSGFGHRGFGHSGFGHHGYSPYYSSGYVRQYLEGTLILDIVDGRNDRLIWRGWASGALDHDPKPEDVRMYVNEAVRKILEKFPPTGDGPPAQEVPPPSYR